MSLRTALRGAVFTGCAAMLIALPMTASASQEDDVTISINPGNVPTTAAGFETQSCENLPDLGENEDGWVFVLPAQGDPDARFNSVTATFTDNNGDTQVRDATLVAGSGDNKAYIVTEAGWTLVGATASINTADPDKVDQFNLTHACAGVPPDEPTDEPTTDAPTSDEPTTDEPTSDEPTTGEPTTDGPTTGEPTTRQETTPPNAATSPPRQDGAAPPGDQAGSDSKLNQTGGDLTGLLVAGSVLVFAGLVALYLFRRRFSGVA